MDTRTKLSTTTLVLHWVVGLSMLGALAVGLSFDFIPKGPEKSFIMMMHKSFGLFILVAASIRIVWRVRSGLLKPVAPFPPWEKLLARSLVFTLLFVSVALPISGIVMSLAGGRSLPFFGLELVAAPAEKIESLAEFAHHSHEFLGMVLLIAVGLHIAAALKHHLIDKDDTLRRMLGKPVKD